MGLWPLIVHFDQNLNSLVITHAGLAYAMIFTIVFLEIGVLPFFFLPSNPFLFVCGTLCAAGDLSLTVALPLLLLASWLGGLCGYTMGSTVGYTLFVEYLRWPKPAQLQKTHDFYAKHGTLGLMFSNYLPVIRTLAPFVAGMTRMRFNAFLKSTAVGSVLWIFGCVLAGYFFGNIPIVKQHLGLFTLAGLLLVIVVFIASRIINLLKSRR